jgi:hypothetical protein
MEAREFFDKAQSDGSIIQLAHFVGDKCDGRGPALVIDQSNRIAVMLKNCGSPDVTDIRAGDIVSFSDHPEAEGRIVGHPARFRH